MQHRGGAAGGRHLPLARTGVLERDERRPHLVGAGARHRVLLVARGARLGVELELAAHEDGRLLPAEHARSRAAAAAPRQAVTHAALRAHRARARADPDRLGAQLRALALVHDPRLARQQQRAGGVVVGGLAGEGLAARLREHHRALELRALRRAGHGVERGVERLAFDAARRSLSGRDRLRRQHRQPARRRPRAGPGRSRRVDGAERPLLVELEAQPRRRDPPPFGRLLRSRLDLERRRVARERFLQHALVLEHRLEPLPAQALRPPARSAAAGQRRPRTRHELHAAGGGRLLDDVHALAHVEAQAVARELAGALLRPHGAREQQHVLLARDARALRLDVGRRSCRVRDPHPDAVEQAQALGRAVLEPDRGARHRAALEAQRIAGERALFVAPVLERVGVELEPVIGAQLDLALERGALEARLVLALLGSDRHRARAPLVHERHHGLDTPHQHRVARLADRLVRLDARSCASGPRSAGRTCRRPWFPLRAQPPAWAAPGRPWGAAGSRRPLDSRPRRGRGAPGGRSAPDRASCVREPAHAGHSTARRRERPER